MNKKIQKFLLLFFVVILCFGSFPPFLKIIKSVSKGSVSNFSVSIVPSNVTLVASEPDFFTFTFRPDDCASKAVQSSTPGIVLNFGTYGYNISSAQLFNVGGFASGSLSLAVSGNLINLYGINSCTYSNNSTDHTIVINNIINPQKSGEKIIKIVLNATDGSMDTGETTLSVGPLVVSKYLLTSNTSVLTAGSPATVGVKAVDVYNNVNPGYNSYAVFSQTGGTASSITYYGTGVSGTTLSSSFWTNGEGTLYIKNNKAENVTFTLTDLANSSISGSISINWNQAGEVTKLVPEVVGNPNPVLGSEISLKVYAKDENDNINTNYNGGNGNVNITQTGGTAQEIVYSGDAIDNGDGTGYIPSSKWANRGYVLINIKDNKKEGPVTFTFKQESNPSVSGTIQVTWRAGTANWFLVTPSTISPPPGSVVTLNVKARDVNGNDITNYSCTTGTLTAYYSGTQLTQVRWSGTGVRINDQQNGTANFDITAWSGGQANFGLVNYFSGQRTNASVSGEGITGRSSEIIWLPAPSGKIKINTSNRTIPPDNSTITELITGDIYDTEGNRIPNGSVFTVFTNLGTITDTDINPAIPGIQVASSDSKIKFHLKSETVGIPQLTIRSVTLSQTTTAAGVYPPTATGDTKVIVAPLKINSVKSSVSSVKPGDTNIPVEIEVENLTNSEVTPAQIKPVFYKELASGYNLTGEYDIEPETNNPSKIPAKSKATYKYNVSATRLKTNGTILLDALFQLSGSTIKFGRWSEDDNKIWNALASETDSWVVSGAQSYSTDLPNYVYKVKSTHGSTSNNFLNGDYLPVNSGLEITFFDNGYQVNPEIIEVKLNETTLVLNSTYYYDENTGVLKIPDIGDKDGTITIKLKDFSGCSLPDATIKFKINKKLVESNFLCYPNPVRAGNPVKIGFQLSRPATVKIFIFNSSAELLWSTTFEGVTGYNETTWDGLDNRGNIIGGGIYTLRLLATDDEGHQIIGRTKLGIL